MTAREEPRALEPRALHVRRRDALGLALCAPLSAWATTAEPAWNRPAIAVRQPDKAVLLAAALAGSRIVAVGERGLILLSDDGGRRWRQAGSVPTSVTLTSVKFADARRGFAAGHAGTVLGTDDAGTRWKTLLDGRAMAQAVLKGARESGDAGALREAERLSSEGRPDRPLLDLMLLGERRLMVIGAYGLLLTSTDDGATWRSEADKLHNPKWLHLYAVRAHGEQTLAIAGEQGLVFRSDDAGASFRRLSVPYRGTFFTLELPGDREMVVAGLRGNVWHSTDAGSNWSTAGVAVPASITGSALLHDRSLVLTSQAGVLMAGAPTDLRPLPGRPMPPLNGVLPLGEGAMLALSVNGPLLVPPSGAAAPK